MNVENRERKWSIKRKIGVTERPRSLNPDKAIAMAICPITVHLITYRALDAWSGMWICVRSKDVQKQLARTSGPIKRGLLGLTTVFRRLGSTRYDCLPDVSINRACKNDATNRKKNENHFSTWKALNHFGIRSNSFKLRSNMCFKPRAKKNTTKKLGKQSVKGL